MREVTDPTIVMNDSVHLHEVGMYEVHPCKVLLAIQPAPRSNMPQTGQRWEVIAVVENNYLLRVRPDAHLEEGEKTREVVGYAHSLGAAEKIMEMFMERHMHLYNATQLNQMVRA